MDLDGDGHRDVISGSYPGELYLFAGQTDGSFATATRIKDASGEDLNLGRAAAVFAADWDQDGDLDLVVGDIRGHVHWLPNLSGGSELSFTDAEELEADDEVIRVPGGDAGPCLADWDGNGTLDLILGCGDGSVRFYANTSEGGMPTLAEPVVLLEAPQGGMGIQEGDPVRCGARAKPCVVDWDGDGRLDLLVGDVLIERSAPPELAPDEQAVHDRLQERLTWVRERYTPALERLRVSIMEGLGVDPALPARAAFQSLDAEQRQAYSLRLRDAMKRDLEAGALSRMVSEISREMRRFRPQTTVHGHVWALTRESP